MGIEYSVNPHIVRGLDYYTRTVFEFVSNSIGAQGTVCGGGRYDGLVSQMGGPAVPALGFGMGIERLMLVLQSEGVTLPEPKTCDLFISVVGSDAAVKASELCAKLRAEGFCAQSEISGRGLKAQMRFANKIGAKFLVVLGDDELNNNKAVLKDMSNSETKEVDLDKLTDALYEALKNSALGALENSIL